MTRRQTYYDDIQSRWTTSGPWMAPSTDTHLRASDAERSEVADRLSRHFADGRLDQTEFKARLDRAMGATTRGDLEGLFDDLPPLPGDPTPPTFRRRRSRAALFALVAVVCVLSLGGAFSTLHAVHATWILIVIFGFLLWRRLALHRHRSGPSSPAS